jgi:hypothetical protein
MARIRCPRYSQDPIQLVTEHYGMITCYLRYKVDPDKLADFEAYGAMWLDLMPRFGGINSAYPASQALPGVSPGIVI